MEQLILRDAKAEDAERLADLAAQLGYPSSPDEIRERMRRYADNPSERIIVAELSGRVVAWTSLAVVDHFYTPAYADTLRLRANVVRANAHRFYQREGFAKVKEQFVFETKVGSPPAPSQR
jgi:hypothetical protein